MKNLQKILLAFVCLAVPLALGSIAGIVTSKEIPNWYSGLNKPFFNPPNWLFAPVWTTLYILLGLSLYFVLLFADKKEKTKALFWFAAQMSLNFLWSFLFFYFHNPLLAFINIVILWLSIFMMIRHFGTIYKPAAYMNIPYLAWVSFATLLNLAIYILN